MSGLVLKLGPNERVLINGAVIENGNRRSRLNIKTPGANILRLRDAIHPDEAQTPVRKLCYVAQLVLSGDQDMAFARVELAKGINQLMDVLKDPDSRIVLGEALSAVKENQPYYILKSLRKLLPLEDRLLGVAAE
ncbi:flagellar biosynthesis repressor FlbT [Palleronia sp. LCG004]|uniref:flagellar biosynthesis repressor FlbT n=1 Tax=Palleronia sp. LCG004 TaxID=3079304 RepID=UPI00294200E9|nr:flagellar biosynthesis repressor FlbT [Palleronia sp. LCG004]WOI56198.1 flagellar biosynthesis repressor FlbT [Palleronia sp. LCG004]